MSQEKIPSVHRDGKRSAALYPTVSILTSELGDFLTLSSGNQFSRAIIIVSAVSLPREPEPRNYELVASLVSSPR